MNFVEYIKENYPNAKHDGNSFLCFTNLEEELSALKNGVCLKVVEQPTLIKMIGKDTSDFLHRVSTNDVKEIKPFTKRNTLFLNEKGRFIAKTTLISNEGEYWVLSDYDPSNRLFSWINKFIIMEDIKAEDISIKFSLVEISGPQADSFMMLLVGDELGKTNPEDFRRFDVDGFTFYLFRNSANPLCHSTKILIDSSRLTEFVEHLFNIRSVFDLSLIGSHAQNTYRVEKLIPSFPNEVNVDANPHEVNLIGEVCSTKGCYIGQEVIARLDTYDKIQRKLMKIISSEQIADTQKIILDEAGEEAGEITTHGVYSNSHGYSSLCLMKKKSLSQSSHFHVMLGSKKVPLKVINAD